MNINYFDLIGTVLSLIGTYYSVKASIRMWPFYILATILNAMLYFKYKIYASMTLEIAYLLMSIYGWLLWGKNKESHKIQFLKYNEYPQYLLIWIVLIILIKIVLTNFSDSPFPLIEAFAVSTSIIAQLLSARKKLNSWFGWIIADGSYIYIMILQKLYFHGLLFSIYLILAVLGYRNWIKLKKGKETLK